MAAIAAIRRRLSAPPEEIAWLGVIPALAVGLMAFKWLATSIGPDLLGSPGNDFFAGWQFFIHPEPVEEARFLIAAALPVLLALAVAGLGSPKAKRRAPDWALIAIQAAALAFVVWSVAGEDAPGAALTPDLFDPLLLGVPNVAAGALIGFALTVFFVRGAPLPERTRATAGRIGHHRWLPPALAVAATALWLLPAVVTDATVAQSGAVPSGHIPAQFEDYMPVANGLTPLVNYVPLYASLLPLVVGPLLPLFDSSITSFSIIEVLLSVAALMALYGALAHIVRSRWIAVALYVPLVAISLFPWTDDGLQREFNGNYYALFPNRYLGPFVIAWLLARRARRGSPPLWVIYLVAGLTVLNNFEFGSACLLAVTFATLAGADRSSPALERLRSGGGQAVAGLAGAFALVAAVTLIRAGELPDLSNLVYWTRTFAREGYGLAPMAFLGLHWALYATYAGALLMAAVRYARDESDRGLTSMLAFAGILGLATGQYFAGRSVPFQLMALFPVWGFTLCLLTWTAARSLLAARKDRARLSSTLVAGLAVMLGFGVMVSAISRVPAPWREVERLSHTGPAIYDREGAQSFLERRTEPGEKLVLIGTGLDHRVAERAGAENVSPWTTVFALFSEREVLREIDALEAAGGTSFFERAQADALGVKLPEVARILRSRGYRLVETDPRSGIRLWQRR
ncbi:MAG: hypothetical protein EXQ70_02060 [Solirubrobacterales bacterium]|nr:hypothetical protein [Solirubrobacterales bacterium]